MAPLNINTVLSQRYGFKNNARALSWKLTYCCRKHAQVLFAVKERALFMLTKILFVESVYGDNG